MSAWSPSRRTVLRTGGAVGAAALAGCLADGSDGGTDATSPIDRVPAGAQLVVHADVAAILADDRLRSRLNELLQVAAEPSGLNVSNIESTLDQAEAALGLDPRDLERATVFAGYSADSPSGVHVEAAWEESALRDAVGGDVEPTSETYNERTVYRYSDQTALATLQDGSYVFGTTAGVEGVIDVAAGDADAVGGRVREAFQSAPAGPFRFAIEAPADLGEGTPGAGPVDQSVFTSVTHGYGGYTVDGERRPGSATIVTDSASAAGDVAAELRAARDVARENLEETTDGEELAAELDAVLAAVEITTDGSRVTITLGDGELLPVLLLAVVATFTLGLGSSPEPATPQAIFDFEYASAGELTITHAGGDNIPVDELVIEGRSLDSTGAWNDLGGSASGDFDGQPAVVAGDSVSVTAEPDYVARVIWQSQDGSVSAELAIDRGPEV